MTKQELVDNVHSQLTEEGVDVTKKAVRSAIDATIDQVYSCVSNGDELLLQPLGRFTSKFRSARKATNLVTKEPIDVPAKFVPTFIPSTALKNSVSLLKSE
jgi:DNA-binding protein HU-beta